MLLMTHQPRNITNLGILLGSGSDLSGKRAPISFGYSPHRTFELRSHIHSHRKLDNPKALVFCFSTILEQLPLISRSIGTQIYLLHTRGNQFQCPLKRPKQIKIRRNVAVSKLTQHHKPLLGPIDVQRLIRLVFLVAVQSLSLVRLHQGCIHIQGRSFLRSTALNSCDKCCIGPYQSRKRPLGCRNEGRMSHPQLLLLVIVKQLQVLTHCRRRWHCPHPLLPPPSSQGSLLRSGPTPMLNLSQNLTEALVSFQHHHILDAISSRQVQKHQRHHHLFVSPALITLTCPNVFRNYPIQAHDLRKFHVRRQPSQPCHPPIFLLNFILERKNPLCHSSFTSLVIDSSW